MFDACAQNAGLTDSSLMQLINVKLERQRVPLRHGVCEFEL